MIAIVLLDKSGNELLVVGHQLKISGLSPSIFNWCPTPDRSLPIT